MNSYSKETSRLLKKLAFKMTQNALRIKKEHPDRSLELIKDAKKVEGWAAEIILDGR